MGSNQLYSLTWGEFGTSLISAVQMLRCRGDLVDVTLAAGGRSFPAHKIVLCAASPFLLNLLKSTPCKHPVVMLAGVAAADLEALLEFVYRGEVSVDPSRLPSLLQAAHCLDIQGLAPGTISAEKPDELSATLPSTHEALTRDVINSFLPIRRRKRTKRRNSTGSGSSSAGKWPRQEGDVENIGLERRHTVEAGHDALSMQEMPGMPEPEQRSHSSDEQTSKKNSVSDQPATCPLCGATLRQSRNLRRHLELLHFGVGRSTVKVRTRKDPGTSSRPAAPVDVSHAVACHPAQLPVHVRPRQLEDVCEPSPVLTCLLPPMPCPGDPVFRQQQHHHADLLRGAGLYADTRAPSKVPDLRQGVA